MQTDVWLAFLQSHVGDTEHPPGSNCCDVCHEYGSLGATCYAWCCAMQDLALEQTFGSRLLGTAAVGLARQRAMDGENGLLWIPRIAIENGEDIRVGDLPCYDYGGRGNWNDFHIEGVVNPYTNKRFQTIGGNRQNRCDYWWNTLNSTVTGFIRPPFETTGLGPIPVPIPVQGDEDLGARPVAHFAGHIYAFKTDENNGEVYYSRDKVGFTNSIPKGTLGSSPSVEIVRDNEGKEVKMVVSGKGSGNDDRVWAVDLYPTGAWSDWYTLSL